MALLCLNLNAQSTYFEGFENGCWDHAYAFTNAQGCYPDWTNTSGTPDTKSDYGVPAFEGQQYASLYVTKDDCGNGPSTFQYQDRGESFALNFNFEAGKTYKVRYHAYIESNGLFFGDWILTNGMPEQVGPPLIPTCGPGGDNVPDVPAGSEISHSFNWFTPGVWTPQDFEITPSSNFSSLWLRLDNAYNDINAFASSRIHIDSFEIITCSEELLPDFFTADKYGTKTETFCYGDDVWVCLEDADFDWLETSFTVYKEPAHSFYTKTGVRYDVEADGCFNLSQFIRERGNAPLVGDFDYQVQMSIKHPDCGWLHRYFDFSVECCGVDASFTSTEDDSTTPITITANANTDYTYYNGTHEFCLYTDEDQDGIYELVTCQSGPVFNWQGGVEDVNYYLVHKVSTPCGDFCNVREFCFNCVTPPLKSNVDCSLFDPPVCEVPEVFCPKSNGVDGIIVYWAEAEGVDSYHVEINPAGMPCECEGANVIYPTDRTFIEIPLVECFGYRVRSVCGNNFGEWSEIICWPDCLESQLPSAMQLPRNNLNMDTEFNISPNPFDNTVRIASMNISSESVRIVVSDILGNTYLENTIDSSNGFLNFEWQPDHTIPTGTYIINVFYGNEIKSFKVLKL